MKIGSDIGSTYSKYVWGTEENERGIFKSTIVDGFEEISSGYKVEYLGKKYSIGTTKGNYYSLLNIVNDPRAELFLFTTIALSMEAQNVTETTVDLVVGLPSGKYKANKKALKESLLKRQVEIKLGKRTYKFTINKVLVMPQGSGLFLTEDISGENLIIDIGGLTWDVTPVVDGEPDLERAKSYDIGMQIFNGNLIKDINDKGNSYKHYRAEEVMKNRSIISNSEIVPYDPTNIVLDYLEEGIETVKKDFKDYDNIKKIWIGGGSITLKEWITKGEVKGDSKDIYVNAAIYHIVGVSKFE